jgi:putative transposase
MDYPCRSRVEFTREYHAIEVERSLTAEDVISTLRYLFQVHGEPEYLRRENGLEFIATAVKEWLAASGVQTLYIERGSPWENAYVESFNRRLEDELLGRELFTSLTEAKVLVEQYRLEYSHERPHSSLGYQTPAEFAAARDCANVASAANAAPAFDHSPEGEDVKNLIQVLP